MSFKVQDKELTGFGLGGYRAKSGVIELTGTGRYIPDWPEEITLMGNTYTLEEVIKGSIDEETGAIWENAEYG